MSRDSNDNTGLPALPLILWLLLMGGYVATHLGNLVALDLVDTDDYMRLHQVMNWLQGADWHDFTVHRLDPPNGVVLHWSRLPDLPLAAVISILTPIIGQSLSVIIAVNLVPPLLLLGAAYLFWTGCRAFDTRETANIAVIYLMLSIPVLTKFYPGKLDHHGWQLLLMASLWWCVVKAIRQSWSPVFAISGGIIIALSLWVGLETLPIMAVLFAILTIYWMVGIDGVGRFSQTLSLSFAVSTTAVLLIHQPLASFWSTSCDSIAINWILVTWLSSGYFYLLNRVDQNLIKGSHRALCSIGAAAATVTVILITDSACIIEGPYGQMPALLHEQLLAHIGEAKGGLYYLFNQSAVFVLFLGFPLLVTAVVFLNRKGMLEDEAVQLTLVLMLASILLSLWQIRCIIFACLFAVPLAAKITQNYRQRPRSRFRTLAPVMWLVLLSPITTAGISLILPNGDSSSSQAKAADLGYPLVDQVALKISQQPDFILGRSALIVAPVNWGPTILARTSHNVLAAPYHRNRSGLMKWIQLTQLTSDDESYVFLKRHNVDFILLSRAKNTQIENTFISRLEQYQYPEWLQNLELEGYPHALLYQVVKTQLATMDKSVSTGVVQMPNKENDVIENQGVEILDSYRQEDI